MATAAQKKAAAAEAAQTAILKRISDECAANPAGFTHAQTDETADLVAKGLVLVNPGVTDGFGRVGHKMTDAGIAALGGSPAVADLSNLQGDSASAASKFELEDGIPVPAKRAFGRQPGGTSYPFEAMKVGQSFHVPKTDAKPNPAKSLASTISSANARYAEVIPGSFVKNRKGADVPATKQNRKFEVRNAAADDPKGPGARVFRMA